MKNDSLTEEELLLLDKILCALNLLVGVSDTVPSRLAKELRRKLSRKRERMNCSAERSVPAHYYSYGSKFFREFKRLVKSFIDNPRLGDEHDKRKMKLLDDWTHALLKESLMEEKANRS